MMIFDDDDVDDENEDEGYVTDEESEDDNEWENFGLAPMPMNIFFTSQIPLRRNTVFIIHLYKRSYSFMEIINC